MKNNRDITTELNILNQAVLKSVNAQSEEEIIKNFTHVIIQVLRADFGFSFFKKYNEEGFELVYKHPKTPFEPPLPRIKGITQEAFNKGVTIFSEDYTKAVGSIENLHPYIKGFVAIPISYQSNNYGTFNICYSDVHNFTDEEKSLCDFIGHSAAQAITIHHLVASEQLARVAAEAEKNRFESLIENSYDIITLLSPEGEILYMSPSAIRTFGYAMEFLMGKKVKDFIYEPDIERVNFYTEEILRNPKNPKTIEFRYTHRDGSVRWLEATTVNLLKNSSVNGIVANIHDITERKKSQEIILHQALHDPLTDLPNRTEFMIRMDEAMAMAKRQNRMLALMFLDMDRFKQINDVLGHGVGDTLLKVAASRFASCVRAEDTVARFGGDEFLVLLNEITSSQDAIAVAQKILKAMAIPVKIGEHTFHPSVSIGIALYPNDGQDRETLRRQADVALYKAKEKGRNGYSLYNTSMDAYAAKKFELESELRRAIELKQIVLYYQPIVNLKTGKLSSLEVLARWQHPDKGLLLPDEFIPLAEETGLIMPLSEYILKSACQQYKEWESFDFHKFRIAVNLSAKNFSEHTFIDQWEKFFKEYNMDPANLELEITESVAMGDLELTTFNLQQLKKMGVRITIDDFGTGYSSLSYLKRFHIHNLKIDRSFVSHCITNEQDAGIVRTIISMAKSLNLKVTAEGVETDQQLNFLAGLGCNSAQGFYIAKPMKADDFLIWMLEKNPRRKVPATPLF